MYQPSPTQIQARNTTKQVKFCRACLGRDRNTNIEITYQPSNSLAGKFGAVYGVYRQRRRRKNQSEKMWRKGRREEERKSIDHWWSEVC